MAFWERRTRSGPLLRALCVAFGVLLAIAGPWNALAFDARHIEPSVYKIYSFIPEEGNQYSISSGSGFLVSGRRQVVTNVHVVEGGERIYIAFLEKGEAKLVEARRTESRPDVDLALLEAREDLPGIPLTLGEYEPDKLAEVIAIGFPGAANLNKELVPETDVRGVPLTDLESTLTTGIVSRMTFTNLKLNPGQLVSARTVQHNSAINPGSSGGPLLDACGNVVGINTLQGVNAQGLFFSIHVSELARFLGDAKLRYASTTRPCAKGAFASAFAPLFVGLTAALALAATLFFFRRENAVAVIGAAAARLTSHPSVVEAREHIRGLMLRLSSAGGAPAALYLRRENGGPSLRLDAGDRPRIVGRGPGVDIVVADDTVSKVHASLAYDRGTRRLRVRDLGSSNGTFVDGARVSSADASIGAHLRLGTVDYTLAFEPAEEEDAAGGWMLSGFDASGRAVQFTLEPTRDPRGSAKTTAWTLGRDPSRADFVIDDPSVSSLHAEFVFESGDILRLRDAGSMNGTHIDGQSIGKNTVTLDTAGQDIAFGAARLRLSRRAS
ncbi:hypothetical protein W911_12205 [Hyphomicrobium nitrativorans NL23]|uniref:FHA domain-containing protein n=1 Tax=Hyphomicrobium nitrativorans NL23 TaxID=1029756 RepID=V5SH85_9HYPH|nr:FHA domain-containing protein [Hyphomicrobium nitrativorans]AHB50251.1 hypothetical protein W911_12205 [Hyphomicrobium nitrativorans NL23]